MSACLEPSGAQTRRFSLSVIMTVAVFLISSAWDRMVCSSATMSRSVELSSCSSFVSAPTAMVGVPFPLTETFTEPTPASLASRVIM